MKAKIIDIEWVKAVSHDYYYKNYKTWGFRSTPTKLIMKFRLQNGEVITKNIYNFILARFGWKKLTEKRYTDFHNMFIGHIVNHEVFVGQ